MSEHISGGHAPYKPLEWPVLWDRQTPLRSGFYTYLPVLKRVKKINQCQRLSPFEANNVHTAWPSPTEHHFVLSHSRPFASLADLPLSSPTCQSQGCLAFGGYWPSGEHSAPPCLTYSLIFDHSVARHLLFRAEMSLGHLVSSLTPRPDKRFYFSVLQGRKYRAVALLNTDRQQANTTTCYRFPGPRLKRGILVEVGEKWQLMRYEKIRLIDWLQKTCDLKKNETILRSELFTPCVTVFSLEYNKRSSDNLWLP